MAGPSVRLAEPPPAPVPPAEPDGRKAARRSWNTYENRLLVVLGLGGGVAALDAQALFYLSPFVARDLRLSNAQVGVVSAAVLITWSIAAYAVGLISDRTGRRRSLLAGGFALFAVFSCLSGLAINFVTLLAARLTVGLSEGPVIPLSNSIMAANSTPSRRGFNLGVVQSFGAQLFGALIGPIVVVALAAATNWRAAFFISGVPGLVMALLVLWVVKEKRERAAGATQPGVGLASLLEVASVRNVWLSAVIASCLIAWYILLLTFLPLYCVNLLHMTPRMMSFVLASLGAAGAVSAAAVPALSDHFGRRPIMALLGAVGVVAPAAALVLPPGPVMILFIFLGSFALGIFPLFLGAVPQESVSPMKAAQATALVLAISQIVGGFLGPALAGIAADVWSLRTPLIIAGVMAMIGGGASLFLTETAPRLTRG